MISCLLSTCCQRLQIFEFVWLKAPFDIPVNPFVLLLQLSFCVRVRLLLTAAFFAFLSSILFSVSVEIHLLRLGFLGPSTSLHVDVTAPFTLCHLTSMVSSSISSFRAWNLLESVMLNSFRLLVSFRKKVLYPKC